MALTPFEYRAVTHEGIRAEIINPYLHCSYGCTYCYCRQDRRAAWLSAGAPPPTESIADRWWDLGRRLKADCGCQYAYVGTAVDPYSIWEVRARVTRHILDACAKEGRHVILATKAALVVDDIPILQRCIDSVVFVSIASLDDKWHTTFEPQTPSSQQRIECIRQLTASGVTVAVFIAPILRGHNDKPASTAAVVRAAKEAGASLFVAGLSTSSPGGEDTQWRSETRRWLATLATEAPTLRAPSVLHRLGPIPQYALLRPDPSRAFGILTTYDGRP